MNGAQLPVDLVQALKNMQAGLDCLRRHAGVGDRGSQLGCLVYDDENIIAEADGYGGGILTWWESCGEDETLVHRRQVFVLESQAYNALEELRAGLDACTISRTEFFDALAVTHKAYR